MVLAGKYRRECQRGVYNKSGKPLSDTDRAERKRKLAAYESSLSRPVANTKYARLLTATREEGLATREVTATEGLATRVAVTEEGIATRAAVLEETTIRAHQRSWRSRGKRRMV